MNTFNVNSLENHVPVAGVQHADETIDNTVNQAAVDLHDQCKLVLFTPTSNVYLTFDGSDPVAGSHGYPMAAGTSDIINRTAFEAMKWIRDSADGTITVTELTR